jgi:hypothetical protein
MTAQRGSSASRQVAQRPLDSGRLRKLLKKGGSVLAQYAA